MTTRSSTRLNPRSQARRDRRHFGKTLFGDKRGMSFSSRERASMALESPYRESSRQNALSIGMSPSGQMFGGCLATNIALPGLIRMKILLTNDDGIQATGLNVLRRALLEVPDVELAGIAPGAKPSSS